MANITLTAIRGDSFSQTFTYKVDGEGVDLSTYTAAMKIRAEDGTLIHTMTGTQLYSDGRITLLISKTVTDDFVPQTAKYDLEVTSGSGVTTTLFSGDFIIKEDVTY